MMRDIKPVIAGTTGSMTSHHGGASSVQKMGLQVVRYRAVWRSRHLIIFPIDCHPFRQSVSAVMEGDRDRLLACLEHSTVTRLLLSPELPLEELYFWAELGRLAGVPIYLRRLQASYVRPKLLLRRAINLFGATSILMLLSPLLLLITLLLLSSSGQVFSREWSVGERGNLFRSMRFALDGEGVPVVLAKLGETRLVDLPLFINVLRGEHMPNSTVSFLLSERAIAAQDLYSVVRFS